MKSFGLSLFLVGIIAAESPEPYDVIVVGLGASGVGALSRLAERGRRVLGLESKGRLGGRVNTQEFGGGLVEFGAEWIQGENAVFEIARRHNINIVDTDFLPHILDRGHYNHTIIEDIYGHLMDLYFKADIPDNITLGQYITDQFYKYVKDKPAIASDKEFARNFLRFAELTFDVSDGVDSWHDISGKGISDLNEFPGSIGLSWNRYGYRTLFDILLHKHHNGTGLPVDIRLNTKVTKIDWSGNETVIVTAGAETFRAKAVIVTVSLGVLKHSHAALFEPSLPIEKARAISAISFGVVDKIVLHYEDVWWGDHAWTGFLWSDEDRNKLPAEDWWIADIHGFTVPRSNDHVITLWTSGEAARHVETLDVYVVKEKTKSLFEMFFSRSNVTVPDAKDIHRSTWHSDPDVRGSYSFRGLAADAVPAAAAELAAPLPPSEPRLQFAGEATSADHFGTVHGALETGWREAERYLGFHPAGVTETGAV